MASLKTQQGQQNVETLRDVAITAAGVQASCESERSMRRCIAVKFRKKKQNLVNALLGF
jgi:hypothetical protein